MLTNQNCGVNIRNINIQIPNYPPNNIYINMVLYNLVYFNYLANYLNKCQNEIFQACSPQFRPERRRGKLCTGPKLLSSLRPRLSLIALLTLLFMLL